MTETAGWGVPDFLPPAVRVRMLRSDAQENLAAKQAEAERERRNEERHSQALNAYREAAEARGELVSAVALAAGQVSGRSITDILAAASAAGDRDDAITTARLRREGHGDPEALHVEVGEPVIVASPVKRTIASRSRHWLEWQEKKRAAEAARRAVEASRDLGLIDGVTLHHRPGRGRRP